VTIVLDPTDGRSKQSYATESRGGGHFEIRHVTPGKYRLSTQREGYRKELDGPPGIPLPQFDLQDGKTFDLVLKMEPLAVVRGRVTDSDGDPLRNANVMAMTYVYVNGARQLNSTSSAMTDDRGDYRLFGLAPGKYFVRAANPQRGMAGDFRGMATATYFPGTPNASEAVAVNVAAGGEASGINISLRKESVYKVRGTMPAVEKTKTAPAPEIRNDRGVLITAGPRTPRGGYLLRLMSSKTDSMLGGFPMSMNESNGVTTFEFLAVPPGEYTLIASRNDNGHTLYAREKIQVSGADVEGVSLSFQPAFDVTGKVVFEGAPSGSFETMRVRFGPPGPSRGTAVPIAPLKADGTFVAHDVPPEVFDIAVNGPANTYLKTVRAGNQSLPGREVDFTHGPAAITLVLASDFADVDGTVQDEKGQASPRIRVTAIPVGKNLGRGDLSRFAFTDEKGHFEIKKLPPGNYKMFAWDKVEVGAPQDPEFRKPYEKQGKELRLDSNGRETVELKVIRVADQ
jgi:hypothetical protein